ALAMFLSTRDTLLLWPLLQRVDTLAWATWHVADAHLALARGDTARARMRVERHYRAAGDAEFTGFEGGIRSFAWGDLLARVGEPIAVTACALAGETQQHRGSVPRHRARVEQAGCPRDERLLRQLRLRRQSLVLQPDPPDGRQEGAGVELPRPLAEAFPVDHSGAVAQVEQVASVQGPVHQARGRLHGPGAGGARRQRRGRESQGGV